MGCVSRFSGKKTEEVLNKIAPPGYQLLTPYLFIDRVAIAKQGDNTLGSIRPSFRSSVCALLFQPFKQDSAHGQTDGHYQVHYLPRFAVDKHFSL